VMIGLALCAVLLLRPRGLLGEVRVVSRYLDPSARKIPTQEIATDARKP
jgi:branched-chain amino acid transport system permease protein